MTERATSLKEEGNRFFVQGDFASADACYSKALVAYPKWAQLYTNRALARLKLKLWDSAILDCFTCLELEPGNMKAHFYLSQGLLETREYSNALEHAKTAYELCVQKPADPSLPAITAHVLRCTKERWEDMNRRRKRESSELEREVLVMMERERDEALKEAANEMENDEIVEEWKQKMAQMRTIFDKSRSADEQRRKVPDWAIDDISFGVMIDPVITKTGKSYERASIMQHLTRHENPTDPLTREPLYPHELRSNLALKEACEEFLEENGWAVDW